MTKNLYLFCGPSGSGKTAITSRLEALGFQRVKSYTTRPPRFEGEDSYHFISESEFAALGEAIITGVRYQGNCYGATATQMDNAEIYILEPKGVYDVLQKYSKTRGVVVIGISAPLKVLEQRMIARGDKHDDILNRLESDAITFGMMTDYCDVVFRNAGDQSIDDLAAALNEYIQFREKG